ncbi:hypothetical protein [Synechococcus elongatus]
MPLLTDRFDCPHLLRQGWRMTIAASLMSDRQPTGAATDLSRAVSAGCG